ncbi:MAG: IS66 family insertion sequence element accessory protein TnpB [Turicibacter sp.]
MLVNYAAVKHIFIVCGRTDQRLGIDGLASIILDKYELDLFDDALFLFCGRRKDRFKALYWDQDGFLLLSKRINNGHLQWPKNENEVKQLSHQSIRWLLEGLAIEQPKAVKKAKIGDLI